MNQDLRELLLRLYLQNNPQLKHQIFIYTYQGVNDALHNPFQFVGADLPPGVKKSIILQNLPSGEMLQAFIIPIDGGYCTAIRLVFWQISVWIGARSKSLINTASFYNCQAVCCANFKIEAQPNKSFQTA